MRVKGIKHDAAEAVNPLIGLLVEGRLHDPFGCLGLHREHDRWTVRSLDPHAEELQILTPSGPEPMKRVHPGGVFEWRGAEPPSEPWTIVARAGESRREYRDPWAFLPEISAHDLYLFNEGRLQQAWRTLGPHAQERHGVAGVRFACWAPNAERVSVAGEFNGWDGRCHPMASRGESGVWELFIPGLAPGALYRFEIRHRGSGEVFLKNDPYAREFELRPGTAARVPSEPRHAWADDAWLAKRAALDWLHAPLNVYEVHLGSWQRGPEGRLLNYREIAERMVPYVLEMGFTHVELLPVSEHPLDESWGYQTTGYFAPTSRYGTPDDLRAFVDAFHQAGIGVILDWVPAHFPQDAFALARFDGTALYEHEDPRLGFHQDWGTHIFNFGRNEVKSFLLASAHYWLQEFHLDGLRVDAVASMLYLDYSRAQGEWLPNRYGGRENLEAIEFLRDLNVLVHRDFPGALTFAEESTAWPAVSRPVHLGGLGFSIKWNMGWMNDTLRYLHREPVYRRFHHDELTFGQLYAYTENFILPLSHDEVVHGKGSLIAKMPGDGWQKFANLRLLFAYQMTSPGKKLNFMGNELAQGREWQVLTQLDWGQLQVDWHRGAQALLRDLNRVYRDIPALHELDFSHEGFEWIDCHDADQSIISFLRRGRSGSCVAVVLNFTPVPRRGYRIGVPSASAWREIVNTDSRYYGGSDVGNGGDIRPTGISWMGQADSIEVTLPPLGCLVLAPA